MHLALFLSSDSFSFIFIFVLMSAEKKVLSLFTKRNTESVLCFIQECKASFMLICKSHISYIGKTV